MIALRMETRGIALVTGAGKELSCELATKKYPSANPKADLALQRFHLTQRLTEIGSCRKRDRS